MCLMKCEFISEVYTIDIKTGKKAKIDFPFVKGNWEVFILRDHIAISVQEKSKDIQIFLMLKESFEI